MEKKEHEEKERKILENCTEEGNEKELDKDT
jgi:hypothetical protein